MNWIEVTSIDNLPLREGRTVRLGEQSLAVFNLGDRFVAIDGQCPHGTGPLADGIVGGSTVTCPLHNWKICLESGQVQKPANCGAPAVRTYPVKVEQGILFVGSH